jgi:hypothetical protein
MTQNVKPKDIAELETYLWVTDQLARLERFVRRSDAGDEFTELIEFLRHDNEQWCKPELLRTRGVT